MKTKTIDKIDGYLRELAKIIAGRSLAKSDNMFAAIDRLLIEEKQRKELKKQVTPTGRTIEISNPVSDKYVIEKQRELISLLEKENKKLKERPIFKYDTKDRKIKGIPDVSLEEILNLLKHDKRQESPYEEGLVRVAYELSKLKDKIEAAK